MIERHALSYHLLSDPDNAYAAKLGLRFEVSDELRDAFRSVGREIGTHNGTERWSLPVPGRFVVDSSGVIRAVDVDVDYTRRPEPEKTLADLAALA